MESQPTRTHVAADPLKRIARHKAEAEPRARKMLEYIEEHIFDDLAGYKIARKALETDGSYTDHSKELFEAAAGCKPTEYIIEARTMIAARFLCETELPMLQIAEQMGWATAAILSSVRRFFGMTPGQLRKAARSARRAGLDPHPTLNGYRRWRRGELDAGEVAEMLERLDHIERNLGRPGSAAKPLVDLGTTAAALNIQLRALLSRPREERLRLVTRGIYRGSREAFEALSLRSREEGRKNRQRGLEIAEIALATVEGSLERLAERKYDLLALAWARLANARRLAMDLDGAEQAIRKAERWAEKAAEPDRTQAEALLFKGSLRLFQRRFTDALAAYSRSVALSQAANARLVLIDALFMRASLHLYRGDPAEAMPDLDKARHLLPPEDKRRRLVAVQHLLGAANLAGDHERARQLLPEAQRLSRETGDHASSFQIQWLEGLMLRENGESETAEPLLKQARAGFLRLGDADMAAVVSLELAMLYHDQGTRADEVIAYASDALPALVALDVPEAFGAIQLLRQAVREQKIHRQILETARNRLLAPAAPLPLRSAA